MPGLFHTRDKDMKYVVSRIATKNPKIIGRTLYFKDFGLWTLHISEARRFLTHGGAELYSKPELETMIIEVED